MLDTAGNPHAHERMSITMQHLSPSIELTCPVPGIPKYIVEATIIRGQSGDGTHGRAGKIEVPALLTLRR
jgi:hypothetical protein